MPAITTRAGKGFPLTNDELDADLINVEAPTMEVWQLQTASFNAVRKGRYVCTGAGIVATLPAAPRDGDEIWFSGSFKTANMTIARNASTIAGVAQDLILDMDNIMPKLICKAGDWRVSQ